MESAVAETIIEIRGLVAGYGEKVVLREVDVTFRRGCVTAIIGGSGCGKSTLLKCIIGLLAPLKGTVRVNGEELAQHGDAELSRALSRVGLLFQAGAMLNSVTVAQNVALPLTEHTDLPRAVIDEMVRLKLEAVGLAHAAYLLPSELSGGMRKRAALARAMALDPDLLLCDEPSAGLDPQTAASLDELILRLKETFRMTVVVVTHELASIDVIADDVVMLGRGGVLQYAGSLEGAKRCEVQEVLDFFGRVTPSAAIGTHTLLDTLTNPEVRT